MLKSSPVRLLGHSLNWLARLTFMVSAVAAALIALAIIMLRYWLLPDIERYHDRITASLASAEAMTGSVLSPSIRQMPNSAAMRASIAQQTGARPLR